MQKTKYRKLTKNISLNTFPKSLLIKDPTFLHYITWTKGNIKQIEKKNYKNKLNWKSKNLNSYTQVSWTNYIHILIFKNSAIGTIWIYFSISEFNST
jgi:hypothetical protein